MATTFTDALKRKGGGEGAKAMLRHLKSVLSSDKFERFLASTPDGEAFWPEYNRRKYASDNPDRYDADKFAADVLGQRN